MPVELDSGVADLAGWKCCGASVIGSHHRADSIPCQDAHAIRSGADGSLGLVVADGAGSARLSHLGSVLLADCVADALVGDPGAASDAVPGIVEGAVASLRETLSMDRPGADSMPEGDPEVELRDYAATLVACLLRPSGGLFLQIGDGAAMALDSADPGASVISLPENGEYANETFFFTMPSWRDHVRTMAFGPEMDVVLLMSDGVTPLALAKDGSAYRPFVDPVHAHLSTRDRVSGDRAIAATLGSEGVDRVTGDDRTLVWAARVIEV